jgi:two-component system CitB family sensor kinase
MRQKGFLVRLVSARVPIVAVTILLGLSLAYNSERSSQYNQDELRALAIARATAAIPELPTLLKSGDPEGKIAELGEKIRKNTDASYVVIANSQAIRFSHPNILLIGKRLDGDQPSLQGKSYTRINHGTLGISVNGKTPIYDATGKIVGLVSAGILVEKLGNQSSYLFRTFLLYGFGFLIIGLLLSELLVRLSRNWKLAAELEAITMQFHEREAMLHSIREGVITLTPENRITLVNDEACRLLELKPSSVGKKISDLFTPGRLRSLLEGTIDENDDFRVLTDKYSILINRRPVNKKDRLIGSVVTLRDRTEHVELMRELDSVQNFTDALRSQQHEYANRLHVLSGLLELHKYQEASEFLGEIAFAQTNLAEELNMNLSNPLIVALLIAKVTIASERGVKLIVDAQTSINDLNADQNGLVTIIGNLLDNGIDAASGTAKAEAHIIFTKVDSNSKKIIVRDSGPGLPEGNPHVVFEDGYSTKVTRGAGHRGLGLAIVHRLILQYSGTIVASNELGAKFVVTIPTRGTYVLQGTNI